jgi:predicted transcriptional regulator
MDHETIVTLAADIVSTHLSNNSVTAAEVPDLIKKVYGAFENLGAPAPVPEEKIVPAVSIRASIKPDAITCLECGVRMKMLKRHLGTTHGLTPAAYRVRWNLPASYPLTAPDYSALRKALAVTIGLGRKPSEIVKRSRQRKAPAPA